MKPTKNGSITPRTSDSNEHAAQYNLDNFKPRFFDFLSGGSEKKKAALATKVEEAIKQDKADYDKRQQDHKAKVSEWETDVKMAKRLINYDQDAIKEILTETQTTLSEDRIGTQIEYKILDEALLAYPSVHTDEIIPDFRRKLRASGTLSQTKMPKGEFNELYQDYVASVALKVAGDLFHILPYDEVYVTCTTLMLNKKTGHKEETPILSVQFVRETFKSLNLKHIDPSDSLANFNHVMKFRKTTGFQAIDPLME